MAYSIPMHADPALHRSGLRVNGTENQELRLLLRVARLRFTAINGLGIALLTEVFKVAKDYSTIRRAILALAEDLRRDFESHAVTDELDSPPTKYQDSLVLLRGKISQLQRGEADSNDALETLACVMLLITAGFPGNKGLSSEWALHVAGMVSLVESLGPHAVENTAIGRMARDLAAQFSIGLFSLGNTSKAKEVWLDWGIHPPEAADSAEFSAVEIILGYPRSLLTILSAISEVFQETAKASIRYSTRDVVQRLYKKAVRSRRTFHAESSDTLSLASQLETCLNLWQPPENLSELSVPVRLAVTSAWEVMRKAAIIFLWRGGFGADLLTPMSAEQSSIKAKFIREMILTLRALLSAADEQRITIMNIMTWPVAVIAYEASADDILQKEVLSILTGIHRRFGIPHVQNLVDLLQETWKRVEQSRIRNQDGPHPDGNSISAESVCLELGMRLPLF